MDYKTNIISGWRSDERISGSKVYGLLMDIKNQLAKTKDKPNIQFRTDLSMYKAECDDSIPITAYIGVEELMTDPDAAYPLGEAMIPVIHLFHEVYGHGYQFQEEFQKETPLSQILALNHYACVASPVYYFGKEFSDWDQYLNHPNEIAAEYAGVKAAYRYLSSWWNDRDANAAVCSYLNYKVKAHSSCLRPDEPYQSVNDALLDFDRTFQDNIYRHRFYSVDDSYKQRQYDVIGRYVARTKNAYLPHSIEQKTNGLKQDQVLTSMYLYMEDCFRRIKDRPALKRIELDPQKVSSIFRIPVRPSPRLQPVHLIELTEADLMFADERYDTVLQ